MRLLMKSFLVVFALSALMIAGLWATAYHPAAEAPAEISCDPGADRWDGSPLKVMAWNVQYMASKRYVFFYDIDLEDDARVAAVHAAGKTIAKRPTAAHVYDTLDKVAALIAREDPDIVLLQEINGGPDGRTHRIDQLSELASRLPAGRYPCQADATYWRAPLVPHPDVMTAVDMRLQTLSRYSISAATRVQLPRPQMSALERPFNLQRALLVTTLPGPGEQRFAAINTHFEAWAAGTGVMAKQVAATQALLEGLESAGTPWVLGGDLNLLPADGGRQRTRLIDAGMGTYDDPPPIQAFYDAHGAVPSVDDLAADEPAWFTHYPNDPTVDAPDRTIDYLFYSRRLARRSAYVIHGDALPLSDHLPVVGTFELAPAAQGSGR